MMDHEAKLDWASRQTEALSDAVQAFDAKKPYEGIVKFDEQQSHYVTRLHIKEQPPTDWGLMVGDIVHNLRSSLDCLAYRLMCVNLGRTPSEAEAKAVQFVLVDDAKDWDQQSKRQLAHVGAKACAAIEGLQPYHAANKDDRHRLSVLRDLANLDKHRHIPVVVSAVATSRIEVRPVNKDFWNSGNGPRGMAHQGWLGRFQEGDVYCTTVVTAPPGSPPVQEMSVDLDLSLEIEFGRGLPAQGRRVIGFLRETHSHIRDVVLNELAPLL